MNTTAEKPKQLSVQPGQKVWVQQRYESATTEAEVEKVGRKYFTLKNNRRDKFDLTTGKNTGEYSSKQVRVSFEEIQAEREYNKLYDKVTKDIRNIASHRISLELLQRLDAAFNPAEQPEVILTQRGESNYHAALKGKTEIWGTGKNQYEALGSMLSAHPEYFGIKNINF